MTQYIGDFVEDDVVYVMFNTFTSDDPSASSTITNFINTDVHIHKDDDLTQRNNAAGITVSVNFDGITGSHLIKIDTNDNTVAGFWVTGKDYFVRIEGTTVDGATINAVVAHFSIENRFMKGTDSAALATTALSNATWTDAKAVHLDANISSRSSHNAAAVKTAIEAAGSSIALMLADTNELQTDWKDAGRLDNLLDAIPTTAMRGTDGANTVEPDVAGTLATYDPPTRTEATADKAAIIADLLTMKQKVAGTYDREIDSMEAIRDRGDAAWIAATGFSTHSAADVKTAVEQAGSSVATILVDTNALQTDWVNGGRLDLILDIIAADTTTDIPTKLLKYVQLLSRSDAAITTDNATELTAINTDGGSGVGDFSNQTEAIEAIRDRGDAAWVSDGTAPTVGEIRAEMEGAGYKLALIEADTNELQVDWANGGRLDLILDRLLDVIEVRHGLSVNDVGASTTKFITTMTEGAGFPWDRAAVLFTSGANDGLMRRVKSYNGTTKEVTVHTPLHAAPADGDTFVMPAIRAFLTPDIEDIADQVLEELTADHPTAGSLSKAITDILEDTADLQGNQSAWATATSVAVSDKTGFSLSAAGVDAILDENVEGTHTLREILRLLGAYAAGKSSGGGTATVTFRDMDDTKDRIVATVTSVGNRTGVTLTED